MKAYRYPSPASSLTREDMALLHAVREALPKRQPITSLIAEAVRLTYSHPPTQPIEPEGESHETVDPPS